jgi:hypothetical protein
MTTAENDTGERDWRTASDNQFIHLSDLHIEIVRPADPFDGIPNADDSESVKF